MIAPNSSAGQIIARGLQPVDADGRVVHGLGGVLPVSSGGGSTVVTVHDLAAREAPWAYSTRRAAAERMLLPLQLRRADAVLAVSQFTADRLMAQFGIGSTVTHLAPRPGMVPASDDEIELVCKKHDLPDEFVLHVGTVDPRKDVAGLSEACRRIEMPLLLAGSVQDGLPDPSGVIALGYVEEADLAGLHGAATVVAFPSRYEGFGLPAVEALACGAPVVATAVGALPELLGPHGYPLLADNDLQDLVDLLGDVVASPSLRAEMTRLGQEAISALSWEDTAARTLAVYDQLP